MQSVQWITLARWCLASFSKFLLSTHTHSSVQAASLAVDWGAGSFPSSSDAGYVCVSVLLFPQQQKEVLVLLQLRAYSAVMPTAVASMGSFVSPPECSINGDRGHVGSPAEGVSSGVTSHLCSVAFLVAMHLLTWRGIHPSHIMIPICLLQRQTTHMSFSRGI